MKEYIDDVTNDDIVDEEPDNCMDGLDDDLQVNFNDDREEDHRGVQEKITEFDIQCKRFCQALTCDHVMDFGFWIMYQDNTNKSDTVSCHCPLCPMTRPWHKAFNLDFSLNEDNGLSCTNTAMNPNSLMDHLQSKTDYWHRAWYLHKMTSHNRLSAHEGK